MQEVHNREYDANMKLIAREWDNAYLLQARDMLNRQEEKRALGVALPQFPCHAAQSPRVEVQNPVNAVSFSSDGQFLATAGDDCTVRVTNANTKEEVLNFAAKVPAKVVAFSKTGLLACGWADGMVRVFDSAQAGDAPAGIRRAYPSGHVPHFPPRSQIGVFGHRLDGQDGETLGRERAYGKGA